MAAADKPAVQEGFPPKPVLRVLNPIVRLLLRSPLHRLMSKQYMLLAVAGRKSGRTYTIPVGRHYLDDELLVGARGMWKSNLRGGADVRVTIEGRERAGRAELDEDPDHVAEVYKRLLAQLGRKKASVLGLKVNVDREPTLDEIRPAVADRVIARIRLSDDAPG
jgi:F420H(2)-dependent quinone reductase